jgi:hypothetical protein
VINGGNVGFNTQDFANAIDPVAPPATSPPIGHVDSLTVVGTTVVVGLGLRSGGQRPFQHGEDHRRNREQGGDGQLAARRCECRPIHHRPARMKRTMSIGAGTTRVCVTALAITGGLSTPLGCFGVIRT